MIFLNVKHNNQIKLGIKTASGIFDVNAALANSTSEAFAQTPTMIEDICALKNPHAIFTQLIEESADSHYFEETEISYEPVIHSPEKIICVGLNYRKHAVESGMAIPSAPVLFSKFNNSLTGHNQGIDISGLEQIDYEAELGVMIGKTCKNVSVEDALEYVFGYFTSNDVSERALQFISGQWFVGKSLDNFLPTGPYLVTKDEIEDPQNLRVRGWLNGELRQDSNTADMIFSVAECISYTSQYMTLKPGDIFVTGTPEGVILGHEKKVWVKPGDEYRVEIEKLGALTNKFI